MMKLFLLISLFVLEELCLVSSSVDGVTYCVKESATSRCFDRDCQRCETLQYYFDNVNATINQESNVTMIFMSGTHTVYFSDSDSNITVPILNMKGEDKDTIIKSIYNTNATVDSLSYIKSTTLRMEGLQILNWLLLVDHAARVELKQCTFLDYSAVQTDHTAEVLINECVFQGLYSSAQIINATEATLKRCKFQGAFVTGVELLDNTKVTFEGCQASNSKINMWNSTVVFEGESTFTDCFAGYIITSFYSRVILSGQFSVVNNTNLHVGATFLYYSELLIAANANVTYANNSALSSGGALYLYLSDMYIEAGGRLNFINNSAYDKGGAIYVQPGISSISFVEGNPNLDRCFYRPLNCSEGLATYISFVNNSATNGGDNVYGASINECFSSECNVTISEVNPGMLSASSVPQRVCVCDIYGRSRCKDPAYMSIRQDVHPGEQFTISVVIVGWDFGTTVTVGVVYSNHLPTSEKSSSVDLDSISKSGHIISNSKQCTNLTYSLYSDNTNENRTLQIAALYYQNEECPTSSPPSFCIHQAPVYYNITILPCPPGFFLSNKRCECYLRGKVFDNCTIVDGMGYFSWTTDAWVSIHQNMIIHDPHCPLDFCNTTSTKQIDLQNDPDSQCAFNRASRLCGGCGENYSLAIGSSRCVHCLNNNNLALLIFFAAAGFLLVFFISALNLTVTQGMVNGLIFYTNIVWAYRSILIRENDIYLKVFFSVA